MLTPIMDTMQVRLQLFRKGDRKKLEKLIGAGWVVASERKPGLLELGRNYTDLVLTRTDAVEQEPAQPAI